MRNTRTHYRFYNKNFFLVLGRLQGQRAGPKEMGDEWNRMRGVYDRDLEQQMMLGTNEPS
jgi:hypothetical protein